MNSSAKVKTFSAESRGAVWLKALDPEAKLLAGLIPSVAAADGRIEGKPVRFMAVLPDPENPYPRARKGEVGLLEGWTIAKSVRDFVQSESGQEEKTPLVLVIDVASQAYGRREEAFGIHQALAASAAAFIEAREAGHPVVGFIVGKAMSGAFLAFGYQSDYLIALNDPEVMVHAMSRESAARITLRTVEELDRLASKIPPMAYDVRHFSELGILSELLDVAAPDLPSITDIETARRSILKGVNLAKSEKLPARRLHAPLRQASADVRRRMSAVWH